MVFTKVPEVTLTNAVLMALVVLAAAARLTIRLFDPAKGVTVSQPIGLPVEETGNILMVQLTLDDMAKVSVQALLEGSKILFLETFKKLVVGLSANCLI